MQGVLGLHSSVGEHYFSSGQSLDQKVDLYLNMNIKYKQQR